MDIGSILVILALFIVVALFIARPFFEQKSISVSTEEHNVSHLLAEQERTLNALQELDFDFALGKIPEEDYPPTRAWLMQRGVDLMRQLDEYRAPAAVAAADRLEAAIAARRAAAGGGNSTGAAVATAVAPDTAATGGNGHKRAAADDPVEALIAQRRRERNGSKAGGFCPKCGGAVQQSDRFCPKCGKPLN